MLNSDTQTYYSDGRLHQMFIGASVVLFADDSTRTVTTYDESGAVTSSRPYTAEENASADALAAVEADRLAREATRTTIKAIVTDLRAEKARAQVVIDKPNNTITGGDTKDVARAAKRIADAAIDLARFVKDM